MLTPPCHQGTVLQVRQLLRRIAQQTQQLALKVPSKRLEKTPAHEEAADSEIVRLSGKKEAEDHGKRAPEQTTSGTNSGALREEESEQRQDVPPADNEKKKPPAENVQRQDAVKKSERSGAAQEKAKPEPDRSLKEKYERGIAAYLKDVPFSSLSLYEHRRYAELMARVETLRMVRTLSRYRETRSSLC